MSTLEVEQVTQELLMVQSKIAARQQQFDEIFKKAGVDQL